MSKDDLQETNTEGVKTLTIDDIRAAIIGDQNKVILLNVFDNLIQENRNLKNKLSEHEEIKSFEE
tara:strand:- start:892 stop:1086 length:195 start_codon:yes stop_codon:yes gene_type:complete